MKKLLSYICVLVLLSVCTCTFLLQTNAATPTSGTCGDNLTWSLNKSGTLTISGTGAMYDYAYRYDTESGSTQPWKDFPNSIKKVVIKDKVTDIGDFAFKGCEKLTSVTIPSSVMSIGDYAFQYCHRLPSITIPDSVTSVGFLAFDGCSELAFKKYENGKYLGNSSNPYAVLTAVTSETLSSFKMHKDTKIISCRLFNRCNDLTSVTIGSSVTHIGDQAFANLSKLTAITIPNSVTHIGEYAFEACTSLATASLGNRIVSIGDNAFVRCNSLNFVTIPDSVKIIGRSAFADCNSLVSATIGKGVTEIGYRAFDSTGLTSVVIPEGVKTIGGEAFSGCWNLNAVSIPNSIVSVGDGAFNSCKKLNIKLYHNGRYLGNANNPYLVLTGASDLSITSCRIHGSTQVISGSAFANCSKMTSVTIPDTVINIGSKAFEFCYELTSVTIPNNVTAIEERAFQSCSGLTSVTMGKGVTIVGDSAFELCDVLKDCYYAGTEEQWKKINFERNNEDLTGAKIHYRTNIPAHSHTTVPIVTVASTCSKYGYAEYICGCGVTWRQTLPRLPHSFSDGICTVCGTPECIPGDLDNNDMIDEDDVIYLLQHLLMPGDFEVDQSVDYDKNGSIDEDDVIYLLQHLLMPEDFPLT